MVRPLNFIAAVCQNMGIGKNGDLPWPPLRCCGPGPFARGLRERTASPSARCCPCLGRGRGEPGGAGCGAGAGGAARRDRGGSAGLRGAFGRLKPERQVSSSRTGAVCWAPAGNERDGLRLVPSRSRPGAGLLTCPGLRWQRNEFKYFQRMTTTTTVEGKQNVVIMGKRTWFSIPEKNRPLKDRINIVLSRELKEPPKGAHYLAKSLDDALVLLDSPELKSKIDMVWIIGGSSIYKVAMEKPVHQRLFVTRILHEFESDTFFPEIDLEKYKHLPGYPGVPADVQEENGIQYKYEVYEKTV